jgi:hypothetical protein
LTTTGARRNGTGKFGSLTRAVSRPDDGFERQVQGVRDVETAGYAEHDYVPYGERASFGDASFYGYEGPAAKAEHEDDAGEVGSAGQETELSSNAGRYTGRHGSRRGKTAWKRVGRVVPVAAVAATLTAGTAAAAYGLTRGGQPQAANLNTSTAIHGVVARAQGSGAGDANGAASAPISVVTATASSVTRAPAKHAPKHAKATPHRTPASASSPTAQSGGATPAAATLAAAPAVSASATASQPAATTLSCNVSYGMLPDNVTAIVSFLLAKGYSDNAAAGIAGNIYQESKGNPESVGDGGGGLIGWTPLPSGFVTGNVAADLQTQLSALLTYNQGWSQYLPALNSAASPADAASIYVTDFERAGIPAASTREASAQNVASACGI